MLTMRLLRLPWTACTLWLVITKLLILVTSGSKGVGATTEECPWSKFSHELDLWKPDDDDLWADEAPPDFSQVKIVSLRSPPSPPPPPAITVTAATTGPSTTEKVTTTSTPSTTTSSSSTTAPTTKAPTTTKTEPPTTPSTTITTTTTGRTTTTTTATTTPETTTAKKSTLAPVAGGGRPPPSRPSRRPRPTTPTTSPPSTTTTTTEPPTTTVRPLLPGEEEWTREYDIVPRVLKKPPPRASIYMTLVSGSSMLYDMQGCTFRPELILEPVLRPSDSWQQKKEEYYTLLLLDVTTPTNLYRNHLLTMNLKNGKSDKLRPFVNPNRFPEEEIEGHDYLYLVYEQEYEIEVEAEDWKSEDELPNFDFDLDDFVYQYDLGDPVGANIFSVTKKGKKGCTKDSYG